MLERTCDLEASRWHNDRTFSPYDQPVTLDKAVVLGVLVVVISIIGGIPAYVIGSRRRVAVPEVAFIPLVGPTIVMLRSMDMSAGSCCSSSFR